MYKNKLIALLEGLECQHIDTLIEKSPEHLKVVGIEIAKYTKIGAESDVAILTSAMHLDGEKQCNCVSGRAQSTGGCPIHGCTF